MTYFNPDPLIAYKQSEPVQKKHTAAAWNLSDASIQARVDALKGEVNTQQTLIEGKEAELSHNKLAKVQKVLNPLSDELKKQRAELTDLRSTKLGYIVYIISKIFLIHIVGYFFDSAKKAHEAQSQLDAAIAQKEAKAEPLRDEITQLLQPENWPNDKKLTDEIRKLNRTKDKFAEKLDKKQKNQEHLKEVAKATATVKGLLEGKKTSQLQDRWEYPNSNWQKNYLDKAKKLMEAEGTSICTGAYSYHYIHGASKPQLFICIKKDSKVQLLYQETEDKTKWVSHGDAIVHFDEKSYTRLEFAHPYHWDPVKDKEKTDELRQVIQTL